LKKSFIIFFFFLLNQFLFSYEFFYQNDFEAGADIFLNSSECHAINGEYHVYKAVNAYYCWESGKIPEKNNYIIRAKLISVDPTLNAKDKENGILFRLTDVDNTMIASVYPELNKVEISRWKNEKQRFIKKSKWKLIQEAKVTNIHPDVNYLDVLVQETKTTLYLNGVKVVEGIEEDVLGLPLSGKIGFHSSKNFHSHFDNLEIAYVDENFQYTPPEKMDFKLKEPVEDIPEALPDYVNPGEKTASFSFNSSIDSPFSSHEYYVHTERGQFVIWDDETGRRLWSEDLEVSDFVLETAVEKITQDNLWAGLMVRADKNNYYAFEINPKSSRIRLVKVENRKETLLLENFSPLIKTELKSKNTLVLKIKENKLNLFVNGQHYQDYTIDNTFYSNTYGLILDNKGAIAFDFIRVFKVKVGLWERMKGFFIFGVLVFAAVVLVRYKKRKKAVENTTLFVSKMVKEVLKEMKQDKKKKVFETDLILRYQITKKEANEIMDSLVLKYGAELTSDDEGRLFVQYR